MRALLASVLLLAPVAVADHTFANRFVLEGRLLGADGTPIPDAEVDIRLEGGSFEGPCPGESLDRPSGTTDAFGDFRACFRALGLNVSHRIVASWGNASVSKPMDTAYRRTVVTLVDETVNGTAPEGWAVTHRLAGKVVRPGQRVLENVTVYNTPVVDHLVTVTLATPHERRDLSTSTDAFGDFDVVFRLREEDAGDLANVTLLVESDRRVTSRSLDPFGHRVTMALAVRGGDESPDPIQVNFPVRNDPPGGTTPTLSPWLVAGVVAVAGLTLASMWWRRRS